MRTFLFILVVVFTSKCFGQKNLVFAELGGNAVGVSVNYERQLTKIPMLGMRVGYGRFYQSEVVSIPVSVHYLYDIRNQNFVELGLGYTWVAPRTHDPCPGLNFNFYPSSNCDKEERNADHKLLTTLGYRRHFGKKKQFMLKGIFTAQLKSSYDERVITSGGLGFGYRF